MRKTVYRIQYIVYRKVTWFLFTLFILFTFSTNLYAGGVGTTGNEILKINVGAKPIAMGGSWTGLANNVDAIYYNPAGLIQIQNPEITLMHSEYIIDTRYEYVGYVTPIDNNNVMGINTVFFYSVFDRLDEFGNLNGNFLAYNLATTISYAMYPFYKFIPNLSIGLNLKYVYVALDDFKQHSIFGDLGIFYIMDGLQELSFGLVLKNFGYSLNEERDLIPMSIRFGVAFLTTVLKQGETRTLNKVFSSPYGTKYSKGKIRKGDRFEDKDLLITLDIEKPINGEIIAGLGVDFKTMDFLSLRIGGIYKDTIYLTFGIGLSYESFKFDYAIVPIKDLGLTHYPSFSYSF
jgi:hypothetical protein